MLINFAMKYSKEIGEVMAWFKNEVTYDGEPYVIDYEQAMAVVDDHLNTIVVARAGSGKTRTLVAKVVYLVAKRGVLPEEIMAFVFNANAAKEINERLSKMQVNGETVIPDAKIAATFHAFSRKTVYDRSESKRKYGKILAGEKEEFVKSIVIAMTKEKKWKRMMGAFVDETDMDGRVILSATGIDELTKLMTTFINRAQQRFLGGDLTLGEVAKEYLLGRLDLIGVDLANIDAEIEKVKHDEGIWPVLREALFVRIGVECYRRYHQVLLDEEERDGVLGEYGTDFNLIVSWASKIIMSDKGRNLKSLRGMKYLLIDEYQDFSQLFLGVVFAIRSVAGDAKLFVVGDDWQAINRFAGSEVGYFRNFEKYFGNDGGEPSYAKYEITTNYRCDRIVVETARRFMRKSMKEKGNFRAFSKKEGKVVVMNPNEVEVGYALVPYDLRVSVEDRILREAAWRMGCVAVNKTMVKYLKTVMMAVNQNLGAKEILILHRNNETNIGGVSLEGFGEGLRWGLDRLGVMSASDFDKRVRLMTMHKSKGLEADVVIILEADEGVIPKLHPDTMLFGLFGETEEIALADQKRLFYVAMTRAKHRLYIISRGGGFLKYVCHSGRGLDWIRGGGDDGARYGGK